MTHPAVNVENLSKAYRIGAKVEQSDTLAGALGGLARSPLRNLRRLRGMSNLRDGDDGDDVLWALKDVSFEVNEGEVVGIIGRNGAGKSTLLKILSRIAEPTSGRAVIRGRVSSLLEVGTGFHPELTGRENVYMNGTILGMTKREIDSKFDEIVDFSGVEKFLDTPTKRYSSGMQVRLAFAVAAHLEPEILIIDEVLAVGDAEFQRRCLGKMQDVASSGRTVLFVSHNMSAVKKLCQRGVWLVEGKIEKSGETADVVSAYLSDSSQASACPVGERTDREGDGSLKCVDLWIENRARQRTSTVLSGDPIKFCLKVSSIDASSPKMAHVSFGIYDESELCLAHLSTRYASDQAAKARGVHACVLDELPLPTGEYSLNVSVTHPEGGRIDRIQQALSFSVEAGDYFGSGRIPPRRAGKFLLKHRWDEVAHVY